MFDDPQLNVLGGEVDPANQTLKAAEANFRAARADIRFYKANLAPTLSVGPEVGATRTSANQAYFNSARADSGEGNFILPLDLDLRGRSMGEDSAEYHGGAGDGAGERGGP